MTVGVPLKLLHETLGLVVTVELKNGYTYRGKLHEVEDTMNLQLRDVTVTARDGHISQMDQCFIRGSHLRFIAVPDNLRHAPFFSRFGPNAKKGPGLGITRGRGVIGRAMARSRARPLGGAPVPRRL
ncbi:Sm-like ribonucleo protein [Rozella allomycis CSF55]|uniref:Small nuclear ribonucleoprotein Sm D3 n=1 Tax=Rozella allomycis (strain CSF55) TaxID=988480 RepID=A0A075B028_ROZAC|nr:Like-Sm (LSM) domain-containing protein [Rozella allomycis CSF55]RKP21827.1 Sm-like ribonucleo protein [Rozella allomycis CSF55]|eukprot:EPZ35725.1 Like-Sm (LSM) domain-containing protein [Rozella allomycis CSF55]